MFYKFSCSRRGYAAQSQFYISTWTSSVGGLVFLNYLYVSDTMLYAFSAGSLPLPTAKFLSFVAPSFRFILYHFCGSILVPQIKN